MDSYNFPAFLYRMKNIYRWSLMRNTDHESVALHSYYVSIWTHLLCSVANEIYKKDVPTDKIVSMALFHDATEVFVGDIAQPVKHSSPEILEHFREIERSAAVTLMNMLPAELQSVYRPLILEHDPELYKFVKGGDLLDAYLKCVSELNAGNSEFSYAKKQILESLRKLEMPEVNYFLTHMAPAFEMTIDELT
ncbi:5'-deoxynucleotidase [Paenibacillus psychroresistens]|uniref:5'-deoxynucleotidase n=1 Tax=Paenibacillus psychroresistens TaxID=1778678 RepID=A0A6B8RP41_9BACL|nr:5'-deoxynucleotidase [Paenibacillus psychroresistens]QGQ97789.1 5'-deoxynucleotidase [Paenibacillus psychroresistens]